MSKCFGCGGELNYEAGSTVQKCEYCGYEQQIPQSEDDIRELDFHAFVQESMGTVAELEEVKTVDCEGCGAQVSLADNVTADECPYCGGTVLHQDVAHQQIKPKSMLPFGIDRDKAAAEFKEWVSSLWFAPNELKEKSQLVEKLSGVYIPFWTYDSHAITYYHGKRGDDYYETEHYTETVDGKSVSKTRQVKKTRWRSVSGTVFDCFDDVLICASKSLPEDKVDKLEPWDLNNLEEYNPQYASGFRMENYQVSLEEGFDKAQDVMKTEIERTIERDIGGDHQRITSMKTQHSDVTFKHIMLPIWISSYRYKDEVYRFLVNGRTGEVQGERPYSAVKIAALVAVIASIIGVIAFFATQA